MMIDGPIDGVGAPGEFLRRNLQAFERDARQCLGNQYVQILAGTQLGDILKRMEDRFGIFFGPDEPFCEASKNALFVRPVNSPVSV